MKQQQGFVLISVLIITTITTMLAFSQINENRLQERIAGNQQKEFNARLAAEKGIIDAFEKVAELNAAGDPNSTILAELQSPTFYSGENYELQGVALDLDGETFKLVSKGIYQGAFSYLKTSIVSIHDNGISLFTDAVVGCDGVTVGNGLINSYDSREGEYGEDLGGGVINKDVNGSLATINNDGDIEFSGSGSVYGNVVSNGSISTGTGSGSTIKGDLTAAADIQLKGIETLSNVHAGGDFSYKNLNATGESITVGGNIEGSGNNTITSAVTYGGADSTNNFGDPTEGIIAPKTDFGICDPLGIPTIMTEVNTAAGTAIDFAATLALGSSVNFNETNATSFDASNVAVGTAAAPTTITLPADSSALEVFDQDVSAYVLNAADLTDQMINISGDITLVIQGDITTKNTTFTLADSDSSLTILTSGQIDMNSNTTTIGADGKQVSANDDGAGNVDIPITIYSSYASDPDVDPDEDLALTVTSNADIYAKVYAPLGNVSLTGGGNIMGAVRGGNVTFNSSAGQIHFDEALADITELNDDTAEPAAYSAVYYFYPTE